MANYANIIVDISIEKLDYPFTYRIPEELKDIIRLGDMVQIPFGKANRLIKGFVIGFLDEVAMSPSIQMKEIAAVVADTSGTGQLIELAEYIRQEFGGTLNQALKTVLPMKKQTKAKERKQVRLLLSKQRQEALLQSYEKKHAVAKARLLQALSEEEELDYSIITGKLNVSSATIKAFEKEGYIEITSERVFRNPLPNEGGGQYRPILNEEQEKIVSGICNDYKNGVRRTYLIHGVTGSGKTEVYMELIEHVVKDHKQAILLIPEIALTYQTMMRFFHRFGNRISILHSKLSEGERYDQLERAKNGEIDIMIGPRSALFTPFSNLGLIIIDEEHENSYKSETIPRYHAREVAIYRAMQNQAMVVLGSATPSVESYYRAKNKEYELYTLCRRYNEKELPKASVIDLREELKQGNRSMFSSYLLEQISERLHKKEQIMLFLNRRGATSFISCRSCGTVLKCPHCDVSLTYHMDGKLKCHYCGYEEVNKKLCPTCGSKYIGGFRVGTQKVEESIKELYPHARVLRMDADTTKNKGGYETILAAFANQEADILVGTQMIVKGHDFPNVTLVGILAADMSLNVDDYHASERTFQLLTQAAGRAGRGKREGEVVIQTYNPEHFAIKTAQKQDYVAFYQEEIAYRKLLNYPPCGHLLMVLITSEKEADAEKLAGSLYEIASAHTESIRTNPLESAIILGPADAKIKKIQDVYRKVLYVKARKYSVLVSIKNRIEEYREQTGYQFGMVQFDFDPLNGL